MFQHPTFSVLAVVPPAQTAVSAGSVQAVFPLIDYLKRLQPVVLQTAVCLPDDLSVADVIIHAAPASLTAAEQERLANFVAAGGGCLGLVQQDERPLPAIFGATPAPLGPVNELRVLFTEPTDPLGERLPEAVYLQGRYQPLTITADNSRVRLYADWRFTHQPMLVSRTFGEGQIAVTTLHDYANPRLQQLLYRLLRELARQEMQPKPLGVGLLGYAPSVGQLHGMGAAATPGLTLKAACDLSITRLDQAKDDFPEIKTYESSAAFASDPDVDLVIIATPPNTHARLTVAMLEAGKHVICEKPLALNRKETEGMLAAAEQNGRHLSCHQNRRWDVDYLAIKQAVEEGLIGEPFYLEMFVGSYNHPCGYWHSHDAVSGGTTYDWGAHYLDWMVGLLGEERITAVCGSRQNRLWHDVTNADQERIQVRLAGGQEVDFIHSDLATVRKPKWYLLGTEGGIIAHWRDVTEYEIDPVLYFQKHDIPVTEMPPDIWLHKPHASGQVVPQRIAMPKRVPFQFHQNLADRLLTGEPIVVPAEESARVVAIMETATMSMETDGSWQQVEI